MPGTCLRLRPVCAQWRARSRERGIWNSRGTGRCEQAIQRAAGIELRAGIHTGEVELDGAGIKGIAVHTAARVCGVAAPGELLVSSTVRDLTAGAGLEVEDRGLHELKGVPELRQ